VVATAVGIFLVTTAGGVWFLLRQQNAFAKTILHDHPWAVVSLYGRILVGYVAAGIVAAVVLHPFVKGGKAAWAALGLALLGFAFTLTSGTHLLYGPLHSLFCAVHDALPAWLRGLYRPWMIPALLGLLVLASLHRWTRRVPVRIRAAAVAVVALGIGLTFLPAARAAHDGPTFVLLIATDSLRADHLSCNGYPRQTSKNIDALAARGTNFAECLVPTASTHESWISMLSSTEPRVNGLRHMFPSRAQVEMIERRETFLPQVLRAKGYSTAAIGGWCGTTFGIFDVGFEHVDVSNTQNYRALLAEAAFTNHLLAASFLDNPLGRQLLPELESVSFTRGAASLTRRARRWLEHAARGDRPFFLLVVYNVTHLPYSASFPYYTAFVDPAYRGRNRYRIDFEIDVMIQRGFDNDLSAEEERHIVDLYDGCVKEFDDQVGALTDALEDLGFGGRTIVGVLADHGDDLYEHGTTLGHGVTLFGGDHANHIPAVFSGAGLPRRKVEKLVRSYDLAPTLLGWLGVQAPARWEGVDLGGEIPDLSALLETSYLLYRQPVPDLRPGEKVKGFPKLDQATFFDPDFDFNIVLRSELDDMVVATKCFAVRKDRWELIYVPGETGPVYRLFDLRSDPESTHDLKAKRPEVFARLKRLLPEQAR